MSIYSDIDANLTINPITHDLVIKRDKESIKQSIRLLVQTEFYDRLFKPEVGSTLSGLLFKPLDQYYVDIARIELQDLFRAHEPRVEITDIKTHIDENENKVYIGIDYYIKDLSKSDTYVFAINKIR